MSLLILDDSIEYFQSTGGVTRYWKELKQRISLPYRQTNIIKSKSDLVKYRLGIKQLTNLPNGCVFHSSYYFCPPSTHGTKSVLTIHDFIPEKRSRFPNDVKHLSMKKIAIRRASHIILISPHLKSELEKFYPHHGKPISIIPHGLSYKLQREPAVPLESGILYFGSLGEAKNIPTVLKVAKLSPDLRFKFAGSSRESYDSFIKKSMYRNSPPSNLIHTGFLSNENLKKAIKQSVAVIIPSIDEGFGLPAFEAISLGVPVIASKIGSFKSFLPNQYLFDPYDTEGMSAFAVKMAESRELRDHVWLEQRSSISKLNWDISVRQIETVYRSLGVEPCLGTE
jgi:glycosyltransferase involved in cell wall biosynthesis